MPNGVPKVFSGARAIIKINNEVLVYALSVQFQVVTDVTTIWEIDNPLPVELAPTTMQVSLTVSSFRVPRNSATMLELAPTMSNMLHQGYLSVEIIDRGTNECLIYIPKATITKRTSGIQARGIVGETWTMTGIGFWDERRPMVPVK